MVKNKIHLRKLVKWTYNLQFVKHKANQIYEKFLKKIEKKIFLWYKKIFAQKFFSKKKFRKNFPKINFRKKKKICWKKIKKKNFVKKNRKKISNKFFVKKNFRKFFYQLVNVTIKYQS